MRNLLLLFFAIFPVIASAAEVVPEVSEIKQVLVWGINLLLGIVLAIIAFQWRSHLADYNKHKEHSEIKNNELKQELAKALQKEEFKTAQLSIHDSINLLRADINRYRVEDSAALGRVVAEIWDDVKDHREENRRLNKELWGQMEDTRDKMNNHQIALARSYHTKEEIADMLDDKLDPLLSILRNIQNPAYGGPRSRRENEGG